MCFKKPFPSIHPSEFKFNIQKLFHLVYDVARSGHSSPDTTGVTPVQEIDPVNMLLVFGAVRMRMRDDATLGVTTHPQRKIF